MNQRAKELDQQDPLSWTRSQFSFPKASAVSKDARHENQEAIYLAGNSLGLCCHESESLIQQEIDVWKENAVTGHFNHTYGRPWVSMDQTVSPLLAKIVGAEDDEVACTATLTSNLHSLLLTLYKPEGRRRKILYEKQAFPSDQYAFESQVRLHGLDPDECLVTVGPPEGGTCIDEQEILDIIEKNGQEIQLVLFAGVQYYTGQLFDIPTITAAAHKAGCVVGWDLAHAVGNVDLKLHDWEVDFAVWCSYKYLNAGPGAIGGMFLHRNNFGKRPALTGWWGNRESTRFLMRPDFDPIHGAGAYQLSNPTILSIASLLGSLELFDQVGMAELRSKSLQLTSFLCDLLRQSRFCVTEPVATPHFRIITPERRGCQLSVLFGPSSHGIMQQVMEHLCHNGIICDERNPDVIRLSPVPLYNTFQDCYSVSIHIEQAMDAIRL